MTTRLFSNAGRYNISLKSKSSVICASPVGSGLSRSDPFFAFVGFDFVFALSLRSFLTVSVSVISSFDKSDFWIPEKAAAVLKPAGMSLDATVTACEVESRQGAEVRSLIIWLTESAVPGVAALAGVDAVLDVDARGGISAANGWRRARRENAKSLDVILILVRCASESGKDHGAATASRFDK